MPKHKIKKTSVVKNLMLELLDVIKDLGEGLPMPFESPGAHKRRLMRSLTGYSPTQIDKGLYYLKHKQLIQKKAWKNKVTYELTITGRQKLLIQEISKRKINPNDGTSCIIVFDIPEEKKKHRQFIRRFLLKNGFINLQKSVMINHQFLTREFIELLNELGLRQNVTVIKGKILYS